MLSVVNMLRVNKNHLEKFEKIKERFLSKTKVPKENNWKSWTNDEIWLHMISQVIVVGGSAPANRFEKNPQLQKQVSYENLLKIDDKKDLEKTINRVLRAVGTRYASSNVSKCRKTRALVHNFEVVKTFKTGPKGLLERLSEFEGASSDKRKIKYVMKIFRFIQSKSARDYLMELGLVKNAVALDIRIQNILREAGIDVLKGLESSPELYDSVEQEVLAKICKPLGLCGVEFDRMLYQNCKAIMEMLNSQKYRKLEA